MNLSSEVLISFFRMCFIGLLLSGIGISAFFRKTTISFWAGKKVWVEEIKNIKAYNIANGIMWIIYGGGVIVFSALDIFYYNNLNIPTTCKWLLLGITVMMFCYTKIIYKKYRNEDFNLEVYKFNNKIK